MKDPCIQKGDHIRLQEISATYTLPQQFAGRFGAQSASLTVGGRNVALWTSEFEGDDPDVLGTGPQATGVLQLYNVDVFTTPPRAPLDRWPLTGLFLTGVVRKRVSTFIRGSRRTQPCAFPEHDTRSVSRLIPREIFACQHSGRGTMVRMGILAMRHRPISTRDQRQQDAAAEFAAASFVQ